MTEKPMTIDELIAEISHMEDFPMTVCNTFKHGIQTAVGTIESHRSALEAGCRGVLRFRHERVVDEIFNYVLLQAKQDEPAWYQGNEIDFDYEHQAEEFAQSLGHTAEFVEDPT
jgi:hypothetical protein